MTTATRRFSRLLYGSIALLALVSGGLVIANLSHGPRLSFGETNLQSAVQRSGQRLLLHGDEPLDPASADTVSVSPPADVTAKVDGSSIDLQFTGILQYGTHYTVTASAVRGSAGGADATWTYPFTTPDPEVYVLQHGDATQPDVIRSAPLSGGDGSIVYQAPHIRSFVAAKSALVVDTIGDDGTDAVTVVSLTGAAPITVALPAPGTVGDLRASDPSSGLIGFTFSNAASSIAQASDHLLFTFDLTAGTVFPTPIPGPDRQQITVADWRFVPGTTSLVAQTPDSSLYLIDTLGVINGTTGPVSLGPTEAMHGFVPATRRLVVGDPEHPTAVDLAGAPPASAPFPLAGPVADAGSGILVPLDATGRAIVTSEPNGPDAPTDVQLVDASGAHTIFVTPADHPAVTSVCLAGNARYVAVASVAGDPAGASDSVVTFVDLDGVTPPRAVAGSRPDWCD